MEDNGEDKKVGKTKKWGRQYRVEDGCCKKGVKEMSNVRVKNMRMKNRRMKNVKMKNENRKNMLRSRVTALWLVSLFVMSGLVVMVGATENESGSENPVAAKPAAASNPEPEPLQTGLVAEWKFDEGSGNIAHDTSGNNNHGTIYGASWTSGVSGSALKFDGVDDYVETQIISYQSDTFKWG